MTRLHESPQNGAASASVFEKGSLANAVLAVIMALVMAFTFIPLPGFSAQAYADEDIAPGTTPAVGGEEGAGGTNAIYYKYDVVKLPLVDHGAPGTDDPNEDVAPEDYDLTVEGDDGLVVFTVDFTATGLVNHYNLEDPHRAGYWIGMGVAWMEGQKYAIGYGECPEEPEFIYSATTGAGEYAVDEKTYDVFYFNVAKAREKGNQAYIAVQQTTDEEGAFTLYNISFENVKLVYDVSVADDIENGTVTVATAPTEGPAEEDPLEPAEEPSADPADEPSTVLPATEGEQVIVTATPDKGYLIDDDAVTVTGESGDEITVYPANSLSDEGEDEGVDTQAESAGSEFMFFMPGEPVTVSAAFRAEADLTELEEAIESATAILEEAVVSEEEGADVLTDEMWVTEDVYDALEEAIEAGGELDKTALQEDVDAAVVAINEAADAFKDAEQPGTKTYRAAYEDELATAEELLDETAVSEDGTDVRSTGMWVTEEVAEELADAVESIEAQVEAGTLSQKEAYELLVAANAKFMAAMQKGTGIDPTELEEAIEQAADLAGSATIAEDPAEVPEGETFYTQESVDELNDAIKAANVVLNLPEVTQTQIDAATATLLEAMKEFEDSAQKGTKPAGIDISKAVVDKIADQMYTTKAIEPAVKVTLDNKELKADTDFTLSYENNIEVGKATVTVKGAGEYTGQVTATFQITSPAAAAKASMPDLDEKAWYMGGDGTRGGYFPNTDTLYLDYALARGLMSGYTKDGKIVGFGPNNALKRAQTATVLYRMANTDITPTTDPSKYEKNTTGLPDVEDYAYYTAAVNWAFKNGVMTGYTDDAGKPVAFGPDDSINREQIATTIGRWCMSEAGGSMPKPTKKASDLYDDASIISDWALEGAAFCNENGIMTGVGGTKNFDPKANAERCQMAKIIAVTDKLGSEA